MPLFSYLFPNVSLSYSVTLFSLPLLLFINFLFLTTHPICNISAIRYRNTITLNRPLRNPPLQVDPEGVFVLPPAAVQELQLKVQPWRAGSRFLYVNAVDVEHRRLVTAWLLCLNVHRPVLSKVCVVFFWFFKYLHCPSHRSNIMATILHVVLVFTTALIFFPRTLK